MTENQIEGLKAQVQKLTAENRKWMRLAGINRLTALPNKLMLFQVILPNELANASSQSFSLSCALICPDKLGDINQEHGRLICDQLILQMSQLLKEQIQSGERIFHCDGANFAIVMADKTEGYAKRRAVTIKDAFREARFKLEGTEFANITCSVGTAEVTNNEEQTEIEEVLDQLYNELCDRLYQAKASGGNYVVGSPKAKRTV